MIVSCDASQLEWRTAVELSQDKTGIKELCDKTIDIHTNNQTELVLPSRLIAKIFLFRTIFRGSGWSFANDPAFAHVSSSPKFWDERNAKFYSKYHGLDQKHQEWGQLVIARKSIIGPTGREWFVPMDSFIDRKTQEVGVRMPWSKLTNYPVQGTGADIVALARISLRNRLQRYKMTDVLPVSTVHDSNVVDSPNALVKDVARLMYEVFDDIPKNFKKVFNYELTVDFPCEVKIGKNMKDLVVLPRKDL